MAQNLPEPQSGQVGRIIDKEIIGRFTPSGKASGETLKEIESQLGNLYKTFGRSDNYDTRTMGQAVQEMQGALKRMVDRVNPEYTGELNKINVGYSNFKKIQSAAASVAAPEGVFSPAQLHNAVKVGDISKDKARFAEGNALMQDLSAAGKLVLPTSVPDSGTPIRHAFMYAMAHPVKSSLFAAPVAGAALAYSPVAQQLIQKVMTSPGLTNAEKQGLIQALVATQQGQSNRPSNKATQ